MINQADKGLTTKSLLASIDGILGKSCGSHEAETYFIFKHYLSHKCL